MASRRSCRVSISCSTACSATRRWPGNASGFLVALLDRIDRTDRQIDTKLTQGTPQAVDVGGLVVFRCFAQAMQLDHGLLLLI